MSIRVYHNIANTIHIIHNIYYLGSFTSYDKEFKSCDLQWIIVYLKLLQEFFKDWFIKKMYNLDEEKKCTWKQGVFGRAGKPRMLCFYFWSRDSRHLFVSDSWYCQIQRTRWIMFLKTWASSDLQCSFYKTNFTEYSVWCTNNAYPVRYPSYHTAYSLLN